MNENKKGFIPVMLTPFKENGDIDYTALTELIEYYLASGASGLFANCLSSEMYNLSPDERINLTRHVINVAAGRVPVVAVATFGGEIKKQADFVKRMYDIGLEAAIIITNMLAGQEEAEEIFKKRVYELLEHTENIPLGFYECPEPYKRILSAEQLQEFVQTGRIIYHKDTCLDIDSIRKKVEGTKSVSSFGLYDAYMVHAVDSLKAGSAGLSCIQGNYFPELIVWLCENYNNENKRLQVEEAQQFLRKNMDLMHDSYPANAKFILSKKIKDFPLYVRKNRFSLNKEYISKLNQLYFEYESIRDSLSL